MSARRERLSDTSSSWRKERARLASATYHNRPKEAAVARRNLRALRAEEYLRRLIDEAPPLTSTQLDRLRSVLAERSAVRDE